jgi:hypothetical protein
MPLRLKTQIALLTLMLLKNGREMSHGHLETYIPLVHPLGETPAATWTTYYPSERTAATPGSYGVRSVFLIGPLCIPINFLGTTGIVPQRSLFGQEPASCNSPAPTHRPVTTIL